MRLPPQARDHVWVDRVKRHCMVVHARYPLDETRVQRQAKVLVERGYQVDVICLRGTGETKADTHQGVRIRRLPVRRHRGRGFLVQLIEYLTFFILAFGVLTFRHLRRRYDSVQVHNLPDFLVFCALAPRSTGTTVVLDLHDLMPEFFAARTGRATGAWPVRLMRWQERLACRFADHVITVTDSWRERLIERGVPADKVSVVMNAPDPALFPPRIAAAGDPDNDGHLELIYHGTFAHRYGVDVLVRAVDKVRSHIPRVHLTLVGDGEVRRDLIHLVAELGLEDHVTISDGMVEASELPRLIEQADIGIVPNRNDVFTDQLLPTKLMEYVAMGVPVIASRTSAVASYFDDGMVEFVTPGNVDDLAARILSLNADRGRLAELVRNANAFNRAFSWETIAEEYAAVVARRAAGGQSNRSRWPHSRFGVNRAHEVRDAQL